MSQTINQAELNNFESMASEWWDAEGSLKPLHKLNPTRISYIKRQICDHFDRDGDGYDSLQGLKILDVGCGGGLVCEPLTRLGATVTGIDAGETAIQTAKDHADLKGLDITYQCETSDNHSGEYDVVLALEIIEHVEDVQAFVASLLPLMKTDGMIIFSTLNRTAKSYAMGIIAAEYILRWLPRGTHQWKKFIKPSELARHTAVHDLKVKDISGLIYNPLTDQFTISEKDIDVNYFMVCKPE